MQKEAVKECGKVLPWIFEEQPPEDSKIMDDLQALMKQAYKAFIVTPPEEAAAFLRLPGTKVILEEFMAVAEESAAEDENAYPLPPKNYTPYQPRTDVMAHAKKHFSNYLKYFGAEKDRVFQIDLRGFDEPFLEAVTNRMSYLNRTGRSDKKIADIIKPQREKNTQELKEKPEKIREARRIVDRLSRRSAAELTA